MSGRALSFLFAWVIICGQPPAVAGEPALQPLLRVETGMHTTQIRRIVTDMPRRRLITCSDDKTIRVWQMPEMRLLSVLRVPMDASHEGQLFAIAVSPDGRTVAAAGWTGWDWEGSSSIYFLDVASGDLVRRIGGFDNIINTVSWLPDGSHLAIGLQGHSGLRFIDLKTGNTVAADTQYNDDISDVDISPDGHVVATALDGFLRLYGPDFKLKGRRLVPGAKKPITMRFSPDSRLIAVGFIDAPVVAVISGRDLSLQYFVTRDELPDQAGFTSVAWSSDGQVLFASGQFDGEGMNPVYRWQDKGLGRRTVIPVTINRVTEIQQMPDNRIAFSAEDPGLGVLDPDGKVAMYRGPDIINFSKLEGGLRLSEDGTAVQYRTGGSSGQTHAFAAFRGADQDTSLPVEQAMYAPILQSTQWSVSNWRDHYHPLINGKSPLLEDYERSRSYAIAPDGSSLLLGTEWAIRLLRADAREIWSVHLPAMAWSVNISRNGQLAVVALSDGTIRWYRMRDGAELLAFFPHGNGRDWIAWIPDGYYMSSVYGDNYVGWHINRGKDLAPDFYRAVQFDRILYRPDVVTAAFRATLAPGTRGLELAGADFHINRLREIAPPRLRVSALQLDTADPARPRTTLWLEAEKNALQMLDYTVFVNGIPVTPGKERKLSGLETSRFSRTIEVSLSSPANDIRVEAFNGVSMGVAETYVALPPEASPSPARGDLYVLAVGANAFPNLPKRMHLAYAARDAAELGKVLQMQGSGSFRQVYTHILTDAGAIKPEREQVLSALKFIEQAGPDDTVAIFLASHGLSDAAGNYYFVPRDVVAQDIVNAQKGEQASSLIPWTAFFEALRGAAGRRVLIVDTCHARNIEGRFEAHSLMKRSASSQFALIVAAKGGEESQEYAPARHGLFTYALLTALQGNSDADRDGWISLGETFAAALPLVEQLRHRQAGPQTPQMVAPAILANTPLASAAAAPDVAR